MDTSFAAHFGAVELDKALPVLVDSERLPDVLITQFGTEKAALMMAMMRQGKVSGDVGDELQDFVGDAVLNDSEIVWSGLIKGGDDDYPIYVYCYHGIYHIWAVGSGRTGYFLRLDDALSYVYVNWNDAVED